jgi:hypothetical protein
MGKTAKRVVYRVRWWSGRWVLYRDGEAVHGMTSELTKNQAVSMGAEYARALRESEGTPSQLVIHGKNGKIQSERTYGNDPRRSKG